MSEKKKTTFNNSLTKAIQKYIDSGKATECFGLCHMARALGVGNQRVYSSAKTPIPGVAYNPKEYNWDALERFVLRRLNPNESMDEFVERVYGIQEEQKNVVKRNPLDRRIRIQKEDGTEVVYPGRRGVDIVAGAVLKLRDDPAVYRVEIVSPTHVVLSKEGTPELFLLSNWSYNAKVDRESVTPPAPVKIMEPVEEPSTGVVVEQ